MSLHRVLSYDAPSSRQIFLALVGRGPALDALVGVLSRNDFTLPFPKVKVAGWAPFPDGAFDETQLDKPSIFHAIPVFDNISSLLSSQPGVMIAIDLSEDSRHMAELRRYASHEVSLISSDMVLRFCSAIDDGRLSAGGGEGLRKTQKLFALMVDQVDGDILILDENGIILDVNQHAAESRGLTPSKIIGMSCQELDKATHFCDCNEEECPFLNAKKTGKQANHTFSQVLPDGRVRFFEAICYPVSDALGSPILFLYIRRDVTEQQHLEQRLQQTEKMAAIGELSTYMAHEIRNPLFSIGGFANALLRNPSLNDLAREKARIIYDESRRLDIILTSILNFARPTEQAMGVFDAETVARQTMSLMSIGSEERGITTIVDIEAGLPKVQGNAENLKQCLINIVKNALEAMPLGGTLTLRARRSDNFVRIDVEDTGEGIPPEIQEQIFSPFFTTKHGGAGLGLAMTRKVIGEMGGRVVFESRQGKGTSVALFVPVALAVDNGEAAQDEARPGPGAKSAPSGQA